MISVLSAHHLTISILLAFLLDALFGDPHVLFHPVRLMGQEITFLERHLRKPTDSAHAQRAKGALLVMLVLLTTAGISAILLIIAQKIHIIALVCTESVLCYYCLAARSLCDESMKVYHALARKNLAESRAAVSMIVGRDTDILDEQGIAKAAVETIAENANDGVIAPLFFMVLGGPVLALVYKAINTMDSMIGYKDETYAHFGFCAAKTDDIAGFIPARLSALCMIAASALCGYNTKNAIKIFARDRYKHASPNSAQTESVCAGALCLKLAGDTVYNGVVEKKEFIGDYHRAIEAKDIVRANKLMYVSAIFALFAGLALRLVYFL